MRGILLRRSEGRPFTGASARRVASTPDNAGLAMLREAIECCPDEVWESNEHTNAFWQITYHALFFTHVYLQPRSETFRPWEQHQGDVQHQDGIAGPVDPDSQLPLIPRPYTKAQALEYWRLLDVMVDGAVDALDLHSPESGFHWYKIPKLEHQLVNLRHLQHHFSVALDAMISGGTEFAKSG